MVALALGITAAGCVTIQPAAYDRSSSDAHVASAEAASPSESRWPSRWGDASGAKGVVVALPDPEVQRTGRRIGRFHDQRPSASDVKLVERLAKGSADVGGYRYRMEGPGGFIFVPEEDSNGPKRLSRGKTPAEMLVFVSGKVTESNETVAGEPEERVVIQRTWAALYEHASKSDENGHGLVVVAPGLFGVPEPVIGSIVQAIRNDGWNVLRVLAPPSRFTERAEIEMISVSVTTPESSDEDDTPIDQEMSFQLEYNYERFAEMSGDRVAEYAYACEALTSWVRDNRPDLAPGPGPLISMSAGAISTPAILTRAPDLYTGTLMIAGGGDLLSVTAKSNYTDLVDAIRLDWSITLPDGADTGSLSNDAVPTIVDEIAPRYLEHAPLDPINLAAGLKDRPIVMLQGSQDKAVPSEHGDQLWEALGAPERWLTPLDHGPLFVGLFLWTPRMLTWLESEEKRLTEAMQPVEEASP